MRLRRRSAESEHASRAGGTVCRLLILALALSTPLMNRKVNKTVRLDPAAVTQPAAERDLQEHLRLKPFAFVVVVAAVVLTWTLTELALSIRCWRLAPNFS
jgi:hypothetical protein